MCTLKLLLSFCFQKGLLAYQMGVGAAFLNGPVVLEVYIKQLLGHIDVINSSSVFRLKIFLWIKGKSKELV